MTREKYATYLRQQARSLAFIARCIEDHKDIEDHTWQVDMPIMTEFEGEIASREAQEEFNAEHIAIVEGREVA